MISFSDSCKLGPSLTHKILKSWRIDIVNISALLSVISGERWLWVGGSYFKRKVHKMISVQIEGLIAQFW
jgi:hypothetical protein